MIKLKDIIKEGVIKPLLESAYDDDADKQGRDDGTSWMANSSAGDYGAKYKGQIRYFDDEDSAKAYAKSGSKDSKGGGDDDKKDKEDPGKLSGSDFDRETDKKDDDDAEFEKLMKMKDEIDDLDDKIQTLQMRYQTAASDERQQEIMDDITDTIEKKEELEDVYIKMNDEYHSK